MTCKILSDSCNLIDLQRFYTSMQIYSTLRKYRFVNFLLPLQNYIILFGQSDFYS